MTVTINHMETRRNSKTKAKAIGICLRTGNAARIIYPYKSSAPLSYSHTALNCRFTLQEESDGMQQLQSLFHSTACQHWEWFLIWFRLHTVLQ